VAEKLVPHPTFEHRAPAPTTPDVKEECARSKAQAGQQEAQDPQVLQKRSIQRNGLLHRCLRRELRGGAGGGPSSGPGAGASGGFSRMGSGSSVSTSKLVEMFARPWLNMTKTVRCANPLLAPWNTGGTYDSAFFDLHTHTFGETAINTEYIFFGEVAKVHLGISGYTITLTQRHASGEELWLWIQNQTASSGASGASLWSQLVAGGLVGRKIFAKGKFVPEVRPFKTWYSLPIVAGEDVWLV
jgi:hypothetical protein